uniref:Serpentine receptor class gamma n=1 Tax=Meloidogyne hapla TaxID=6305 RepID=A0A1I8BPA4_MELHA
MPAYLYIIGSPLFHFAIMIERVLATVYVKIYEKQGKIFSSITNYSLSQSYQAKQNILVMRVIFPLDFSYSFTFALYNILSNFIRYKREEYGQLVYVRALDGIILVIK